MYSVDDVAKVVLTVSIMVVFTEVAVSVFWNYMTGFDEKRYKISKQGENFDSDLYMQNLTRPTDLPTPRRLSVIPVGEDISEGHAHQAVRSKTVKVHVYNVSQPVTDGKGIQCVQMRIGISYVYTPICIYPPKEDTIISASLADGNPFQKELLEPFIKLLRKDPTMHLIDIGANLGIWTLTAAKLGRKVIAVEPYPPTVARLHLSIVKGHLESFVTIITDPISDHHHNATLKMAEKNMGGISLQKLRLRTATRVSTITMDDLVPYLPRKMKRAFIKMDIESMELRALSKCDKLLRAIDIPVIMFEFFQYKNLLQRKELRQFGLWMKSMNYIPYNSLGKNRERLGDVTTDRRYRQISDLYLIKKESLQKILRWTEGEDIRV
ncbi:uncharacterized protein LOC106157658 [Lingula anatina]|uniref:Uncharacterized protein LOC106157658 n=1 Tax=Lingula anatina TaxID=7574 RepID=A0A1S3HS11_LINAN|nr:uncharacterized protein LOC106157658 [Lingula anatina]|eukprot:XP_013388827.1 uncharacterized protein LOC106157658 [Lingula anatina]